MKINLSLSGGGIKGIGHLGGIEAIEDNGLEIVGIAGSSAGAIIAALYGAGYTLAELKELMYQQDFSNFKDSFSLIRLIKKFGLYKGDTFLNWIQKKLTAKGIVTFRDLEKDVRIIASEVTYRTNKIFSKATTPDSSVAEAVRMSMSIPVFYVPYHYQSELYVDGALINNFPLRIFNHSRFPTLGLMLTREEQGKISRIKNFLDYLATLVDMIVSVNEQRQIELSDSDIISIPINNVKVTEFSLTTKEKDGLYNRGYQIVNQEIDRFKDRRFKEGLIPEKAGDIRGTVVELEEFSRKMAYYIRKKININEIDGIIASGEDDYLFSYLVAQRLKKKFTVVHSKDKFKHNLNSPYRYNRIEREDKVIILSFVIDNKKEIKPIMDRLKDLKVETKGCFTFINNGDVEKDLKLTRKEVPFYAYHIIR